MSAIIGECIICLSDLSSSDAVAINKCGHVFHQKCIKQWITCSGNCPKCRVRTYNSNVIKLYIDESNSPKCSIQNDHAIIKESKLKGTKEITKKELNMKKDNTFDQDGTIFEEIVENVVHCIGCFCVGYCAARVLCWGLSKF